jgi:outer membrane immunogenic protein
LMACVGLLAAGGVYPLHAQPGQQMGPPGWSGPFIGLTAGYGSGHSDQTDSGITAAPPQQPSLPSDGHYSLGGGLLGGALGYNWQQGRWVFGLEGDFSWASISGSSSVCGPATVTPHPCGTKLDALGTFRGRVGYAVGPTGSILPFVTGGLAVGNVGGWDSLTPAVGSSTLAGWTVGAGIEAMVAANWTVKFEYLHVDLGSAQLFNVVPGVPETISYRSDDVRVGVNYRWGGPLIAKY